MWLISLITKYLFIDSMPEKSDVILVPGSPFPEPMERAVRLYFEGLAPFIVTSGNCWIFHKSGGERVSECDMMASIAMCAGVPGSAIIRENKARHTLDNARLSKSALDMAGVDVRVAIICCQSFHARRCLKAYRKYFKDVKLILCPVPTRGFDAANWHKTPVGVFKVCTELLKCTGLFFYLISLVRSK